MSAMFCAQRDSVPHCTRDNEDEAWQAKVLTKDEARRIAINIAETELFLWLTL
jgi:hypothetical protein